MTKDEIREWMASRPHTPECRCRDCRVARGELPPSEPTPDLPEMHPLDCRCRECAA